MSKRKGRKPSVASEIKSVMRAPASAEPEPAPTSGETEEPSEAGAGEERAETRGEDVARSELELELEPIESDPAFSADAHPEVLPPRVDDAEPDESPSDEPEPPQPAAPSRTRRLRAIRGREATDDDIDAEAAAASGSALNADLAEELEALGASGEPEEEEDNDVGFSPAIDLADMDADDTEQFLRGLIEALLFTSQKPLDVKELARSAGIDKMRAKELLEQLMQSYDGRGLCVEEVAGGYVMRSSPRYAPYIQKILALRPVRLSRAQLETLAIVAYRQPVTKPEVDDIRGVDSGQVIKGLLERSLLKMLGKKDEPGRPTLYGTTNDFLELLNLQSLKDLPTLREYTELSEESQRKFLEMTGEAAPNEPITFERPPGDPEVTVLTDEPGAAADTPTAEPPEDAPRTTTDAAEDDDAEPGEERAPDDANETASEDSIDDAPIAADPTDDDESDNDESDDDESDDDDDESDDDESDDDESDDDESDDDEDESDDESDDDESEKG